jgi:regulator of sigma E protease
MSITPKLNKVNARDDEDAQRGVIGVLLGNPDVEEERIRYPVGEAFVYAVDRCILITKLNFKILADLIIQREWGVLRESVGGPVAIGVMAYKYAQKGLWDFLNFFAIINVIIAVMNLIPFPIFDGGHIALATYESVTRRSVPPKVLLAIYQVSLFFILALAVLVTANDVWQNGWRLF